MAEEATDRRCIPTLNDLNPLPGRPPGPGRTHLRHMLVDGDRTIGCWEWPFTRTPLGYGRLRLWGRDHYVHRLAFALTHGRWPELGRHACDNPPCFNPEHIEDGDHTANYWDSIERCRRVLPRGELCPTSKLTNADVRKIRDGHRAGRSIRSLAIEYRVDWDTVKKIVTRISWKHLS